MIPLPKSAYKEPLSQADHGSFLLQQHDAAALLIGGAAFYYSYYL